jgi:hypothetical protein
MKLRNILVGSLVAVMLAGCGLCETSQPVHQAPPMPRGKDESAMDHSLKAMDSQASAMHRAYNAQ